MLLLENDFFCNKIKYFPIKILLFFLVFTELLYAFGPLIYKNSSSYTLYVFFFIVNISLYLGYKSGIKYYIERPKSKKRRIKYLQLLKILIWFSFFMIFVRMIALWDIKNLSPIAIISHLINSITAPGDVYESKLSIQSGVAAYFSILMSPLTFMTIPIAIYNRNKLSKFYQLFLSLLCVLELSIWVGQGVRKGIIDLFLIICFMMLATKPWIIINLKKYKSIMIFAIIFVFIFVYYFLYSNLHRYGLNNPEDLVLKSTIFEIKDFYKNQVSALLLMIICSIESYLCQGYDALSYALDSDFTYSYGLGSSWFGLNLSNRLGLDIASHTYVFQLEKTHGIDPMINWHSIYTWLASDFTFIGVPVFVFFVGYLLATTWLDTLLERSFYAPAIFMLFVIMTFYFFANNQIFSLQFIAFFAIFILWLNDRGIYLKKS